MTASPASDCRPPVAVGLVSPGELGTALARELRARQVRVITTTAGRSVETRQRARQAGLELVADPNELGRACDVVLSTVDPAAAVDVARELRGGWTPAWRLRTFVDANSIAPETMRQIAGVFAGTAVQVVDAAIHGQAGRLAEHATMYMSGADAERIDGLFHPCLRTQIVGEEPGQASLMKMCLGSLTKGLVALYLQAGCLAHRYDAAQAFDEELNHFYPELGRFLCRSVPTYRQHARRRSEEMGELAGTLSHAGLDNRLALDVQALLLELAACDVDTVVPPDDLPAFLGELSQLEFRLVPRPAAV